MTQAPSFQLTAISSGRVLDSDACAGRHVLLLFQNAQSAYAAKEVQESVRERYGDPSTLVIASVVDLSSVPALMRGMVDGVLRGAYAQSAPLIPGALDPADYIIILPDRDGSVTRAFDVKRFPTLVLLDDAWREQQRASGSNLGQQALDWLAETPLSCTDA